MKKLVYTALLMFCFCVSDIVTLNGMPLDKGGQIEFRKKDNIALPTYNWPRTLLAYPVEFEGGISGAGDLTLIDDHTAQPVPFQLSRKEMKDGRIISADVNFFASLPSGGDYSYTLKRQASELIRSDNPVITMTGGERITVVNGILKVELPVSAAVNASEAPAMSVAKGGTGGVESNNSVRSDAYKIMSVTTSELENGDLFALYQVEYRFENGGKYLQNIKVVSGYPFVILDEDINGVAKADGVRMNMAWKDFKPAYRYPLQWDRNFDSRFPWYKIDEPVYTNYSREDPAWSGMGMLENISEKMIFRLTPFGGNSVREQVPLISFWEKEGNELGVFVYDHARWDDKQYGIWQQGPDMSVYFRYADKTLHFTYPIMTGTRSTAITIHRVADGEKECEKFDRALDAIGGAMNGKNTAYRYTSLLHNRYALLNLDKVKEWQLEYPEKSKRGEIPFRNPLPNSSPDQFHKEAATSCMAYYMMGLNGYPGVHSIEHRNFYGRLTQGYLENYKQLDAARRKQVEALFLLAGYVTMTEGMNAIRTNLAGTANMAADGWAVTGVVSSLFPEHEMAPIWADYFGKSLEIYGLFYTRPDVREYETKGGRWVESLGIYNWAYFKPTVSANLALYSTRGENRFANHYMAQRGRWMVDMLTAPVKVKGKTEAAERLQRVYTAHGAHSGGRFVEQFSYVYQVGKFLENYDPIVAEHMYWTRDMGVAPEGKPADSKWDDVFTSKIDKSNRGTNPHLKSEKYTGHGIVLRAGVDTPEELSVHLDQVDKGPNYRWGNQGDGNSGGIYFYAGGNIYSGHENEAAGDHVQNDPDGVCNFGVMKNGAFRTVGYNELTAPLYDLDIAQFAEVRSSDGADRYSWPEYVSRSVMLVGTDYFLIYDQTGTNWRASHRFSWFVNKNDKLPKIVFFGNPARRDHWYKAETENSRGFYRDNNGSLLTLVTHKKEVTPVGGALLKPSLFKEEEIYEHRNNRKGMEYEGIYEITTADSRDIVFRNSRGLHCQGVNYSFEGEAGLIRKKESGDIQMVLFKGSEIGYGPVAMNLDADGECAVALIVKNQTTAKGRFKNYGKATLRITGIDGGVLYIDGEKATFDNNSVSLPTGDHTIEYTQEAAIPMPSFITSTEHTKKGADIYIDRAPTAKELLIELSDDGGRKWKTVGKCDATVFSLSNLKSGKYHVRAVSLNDRKRADHAYEYPVYVDDGNPHYPEGLRLMLGNGKVSLSWGQVLGVKRYILYRKNPASGTFRPIYEGEQTSYTDNTAAGVSPCHTYPADLPTKSPEPVYEYYVVAVNGRGTSEKSPTVDTSPSSWANWYPSTELKFKRQSAFWMEPYVQPNMVPSQYYPN